MAKILTYPDHTLLQISGLIRDFKDPKISEIIDELKSTAEEHNLKGLAAIQIGIPLRIIVFKDEKKGEWIEMLNPAIYGKEGKYFPSTETDESLPEAKVTVQRYPTIKVMYEDRGGNTHYYTATGKESVWLQRKIDMIFGGYLFDKLPKKKQKEFFKEYGSYGDTCPTSFVKDKILTALRFFLVLHFFALLVALFSDITRFVIGHNVALFSLEFVWILFYALYAKYETTKYKNCTSCQGANTFGTAALYTAAASLLFIASFFLK